MCVAEQYEKVSQFYTKIIKHIRYAQFRKVHIRILSMTKIHQYEI